jgi:alpha-tubulin suppressor-like RCC1 family protein
MSSSSVLYSINNKKHEDVESYEIHQLLEDKEVVQMSAGHDFCLFVLSNGEVYGSSKFILA